MRKNNLMFTEGDSLVILDPFLRKTAPPGRNRLKVRSIQMDGWVHVTYEDGTYDYLMLSQLVNHWGISPGARTKLWKVLNKG